MCTASPAKTLRAACAGALQLLAQQALLRAQIHVACDSWRRGMSRQAVSTRLPTKGQLMQKGMLAPAYACCCKRRYPQRSERLAHRAMLPLTKLVLH